VEKYLRMIYLERFKFKKVSELSGGMKQRVALARALAYECDLVILDEPFSALDSQTRDMLLLQIQRIWEKTKKTFIFVTHNIEEAVMLSNRIILLSSNPGRVKKMYEIALPRPRTIINKEISEYVVEIQRDLKEEVMKIVEKEYDSNFNSKENDIFYNPSDDMEYYL
ncbi:MAG: ATP-binding cassette domain-containing protein, partial [Clostridium sp.]